jgi:hypothetical protein
MNKLFIISLKKGLNTFLQIFSAIPVYDYDINHYKKFEKAGENKDKYNERGSWS